MVNKWRLILDEPLPGLVNMQRDLKILEEVAAGEALPTLRLYRWAPPALSIGRFQDPSKIADLAACRRLGIDLVRRPTGGRALLHDQELTYSLAVPDCREIIPAGITPSYRFISRALLLALSTLRVDAELSPEITGSTNLLPGSCFDTPSAYELRVQGKKVVGSAQLRRGGGLLQHGSILLTQPLNAYRQILRFQEGCNRDAYLESLRQKSAGLLDLGYRISIDELSDALTAGFADIFNVEWE